jgi:hypothetical protein
MNKKNCALQARYHLSQAESVSQIFYLFLYGSRLDDIFHSDKKAGVSGSYRLLTKIKQRYSLRFILIGIQ